MNKKHKQRLYLIALFAFGLTMAAGFILYALRQNINVFVTPSDLATHNIQTGYHLRLGGLVKANSLVHQTQDLAVDFIVTDNKHEMRVHYRGVLPDLFKEGKGVIAEGSLQANGDFLATQVLAKHDENYMPKNVYQALRDK